MDFNLTKEQELIRKALAEFTEEEVKPIGHVRTEGVRRTWR